MTNDTASDRRAPIRTAGRLSAHLRTHLTVLLIVAATELIGMIMFSFGPGQVVFLPLLYAVVLDLVLSYSILGSVIKPLRSVVNEDVSRTAPLLLIVALTPLGMKYGTLVTPSFHDLVAAGSAFVPQEFRSLGTILTALPFALLLGLKRESVDAVVSVAREPILGVIIDKYGIESPEGCGVLGTYMTGAVLGTVLFGLLGGFAPVTGLYPLALSMACGMGSASTVTACSASLATAVGDADVAEDQILSFVTTSNFLTGTTGLYMVILVGLPVITRLYAVPVPVFGRDTTAADGGE